MLLFFLIKRVADDGSRHTVVVNVEINELNTIVAKKRKRECVFTAGERETSVCAHFGRSKATEQRRRSATATHIPSLPPHSAVCLLRCV